MPSLHVGSMGWSYDFWKGSFYPEQLRSNQFLAYYSSKFETVEVDSTFYRIPKEQTVLSWKQQTPKDFVFSLKFPRVVTHIKMLQNCEEETRVFLERARLLGEKLGPLLLQFPVSFRSEHISVLDRFLDLLPKRHRYVIEVRNKKLLEKSFYSILRNSDVALAWVDSPVMPLSTEFTSNFIYVRWQGDRGRVNGDLGRVELDRAKDINVWVRRLKPFVDDQTEVFRYFSKFYSGYPPSDIEGLLANWVHSGS